MKGNTHVVLAFCVFVMYVSSAFDMVDQDMALKRLKALGVKRFVRNFLCGRKMRVHFGRSTMDRIHSGCTARHGPRAAHLHATMAKTLRPCFFVHVALRGFLLCL
jgi:hypothetical protein